MGWPGKKKANTHTLIFQHTVWCWLGNQNLIDGVGLPMDTLHQKIMHERAGQTSHRLIHFPKNHTPFIKCCNLISTPTCTSRDDVIVAKVTTAHTYTHTHTRNQMRVGWKKKKTVLPDLRHCPLMDHRIPLQLSPSRCWFCPHYYSNTASERVSSSAKKEQTILHNYDCIHTSQVTLVCVFRVTLSLHAIPWCPLPSREIKT